MGSQGPIKLNARRQQVVLAVLLLEANRLVPVDRLVDAVWAEAPPLTARGQIQTCVSALRRRFGRAGLGDRIGTRRSGYVLQVSDDEVDLDRFDRLVADGRAAMADDRHADAMHRFRSALSLWRAEDALSGIDSDLVRAAVTSLTERRLNVVEECHSAELALGRHRELVDGLMHLVSRYPLRERLRHQLMLALYRSGRPGEALAAYQVARQTLVAELGIEPSADLRHLQDAILGNDPALDLPAAVVSPTPITAPEAVEGSEPDPTRVPRMLPADNPLLTGRDHVVAAAVAHLAGDTDLVATTVLTGRAGVGKTALAVHIGHRLASAFPDGQLYARLDDEHGDPVCVEQVLDRLLRALDVPSEAIPEGREERAARYRSALAGRRVFVVLDGATDNAQVLPLLPGSPTCSVLVTSGHRLTGVPGAQVVELDQLSIQHATNLLTAMVGGARVAAEPAAAFELIELCGGYPLALCVIGERLAARPHWTITELTERLRNERRRLDELTHGGLDVRARISVGYRRLRPAAQRLFRLLGVVDVADFPAWIAGPLLGDTGADVRDELERLVDAQLIDVQYGHGTGARYRMPKLLQLYARELLDQQETPEARADALARLLGAWQFLAEQAHRREFSGAGTIIHGSADRWPLPAALVEQLLGRPAEWLEAERASLVDGVRQAAALGLSELCWDLAITLVGLFQSRGHLDDWRSTHAAALTACRQARNRRGEASILYSLGTLNMIEQHYDEAAGRLTLAQRAFEEVGEDHGRALCLRSAAFLSTVGTSWLSAATAPPMRRPPGRPRTAVPPR